jgi:tRNA(Ile)-lysidine synthase
MRQAFAFEQAVLSTIVAHAAIAPDDHVLVAVSGGADSTALLASLHALRERGAVAATLAVAHLNHGLRGAESERDADAVRALALRLGLPCDVERCDALAAGSPNLEARARTERHAFLQRAARRRGASRIALGHTRDDQAETLLMRLARGAGPASLAAMPVVRPDGVIRPLLEQPHDACVTYLRARGIAWVEDTSNADPGFFRNRVRHRLLPALSAELGVDVRARLARLAHQLAEESALAEQRIDELLSTGEGALPLAACRTAGAGAPRLVHAWLARAGVRASEAQVGGILRIAGGTCPSAGIDLGAGYRVVRRYDGLALEQADGAEAVPSRYDWMRAAQPLPVPGSACLLGWRISGESTSGVDERDVARVAAGATQAVLDADLLRAPLALRAAAAGDRVRLVYGRRKLADILIDAKVPRQERRRLAVVHSGDDILWVPGVVRSIVAHASSATRRFALLRAERIEGSE